MITGQEITITTYPSEFSDPSTFSYQKTKVTCYTQDGFLLFHADVSAYETQMLGNSTYLILICIFIGWVVGLLTYKLAIGEPVDKSI